MAAQDKSQGVLNRRTFVIGATVGAVTLGTTDVANAARVPPRIIDDPFTLGIASGDHHRGR